MSPSRSLVVYPNPFNPRATIRFSLGEREHARVSVHDVAGREIARLADGVFGPGATELTWSGKDRRGRPVASGVYLVRLTAASHTETKRAVLLK